MITLAGLMWRRSERNAPITIAVLPLDNLNRDPGDDYLADGLTDELIRNLSTLRWAGAALPHVLVRA